MDVVTKLYDAAKMLAALAGIPFQMVVPLQVSHATQGEEVYWPSPPEERPERGIVLES